MAVSLKVNLRSIGTTKTMRFVGEMSVSEMAKEIRDKVPNAGGSDHGIFQPGTITQKPRWLRIEKTLRFYDLQSGMEIEYKKRHRQLKVKLLDETVRTFMIDESATVAALTEHVGYKMGIKNPEEFSFKIVRDDSQDWLHPNVTLPEQGVTEDETVLLKKKFFFNDANVDRSDPVQLHLLYVQSRDAIVSGDHPCTKDEARDLAALQCQITFGDCNGKNKNLVTEKKIKEFLPPQFHKLKGFDKDIMREYQQKLTGMIEVNAKYRYVQLCRSLKTYGITCFQVKEKDKKKKNKMIPVLLGITRHAILRMDPETKEVIKEFPLPHLKQWSAAPAAFTMDFGDYEESYYTVITNESDAISQLIAGYIDIILKTRKDAARIIEEEEPEMALEEHIAPVYGRAYSSVTTNNMAPGMWDPSTSMEYAPGPGALPNYAMQQQQFARMMHVKGLEEAVVSATALVDNFQNPSLGVALGLAKMPVTQALTALTGAAGQLAAAMSNYTPVHTRPCIANHIANTNYAKLIWRNNQTSAATVDVAAQVTLTGLGDLIASAKAAAEATDDPLVLDGARCLTEAIRTMLAAAASLKRSPTEQVAVEQFRESQLAVQSAATHVQAATAGTLADQVSQNLILESAKAVAAAAAATVAAAVAGVEGQAVPVATRQEVHGTARAQASAAAKVLGISTALAPGILNPAYTQQIATACRALADANQVLSGSVRSGCPDPVSAAVSKNAQLTERAMAQLLNAAASAGKKGREPIDFITPLEDVGSNLEQLQVAAKSNPGLIPSSASAIQSAANNLVASTKTIASGLGPDRQAALLERSKNIADASNRVGQSARAAVGSGDAYSAGQVVSAGQATMAAVQALLAAAPEAVIDSVAYWSKAAAAQTSALMAAAMPAKAKDPGLSAAIDNAAAAVSDLVEAVKQHINCAPGASAGVVVAAKAATVPVAALLGATAQAVNYIEDPSKKVGLSQAISDAQGALQKLATSVKAASEANRPRALVDASEQLRAATADLDVAYIAAESAALPRTLGYTTESSTKGLGDACKALQASSTATDAAARHSVAAVGPACKTMTGHVYQVATAAKALAAFSPDAASQKQIVAASKGVAVAAQGVMEAAKNLSENPSNQGFEAGSAKAQEDMTKAIGNLLTSAHGLDTGELDEAADVLAAEAVRMTVSPPAKVSVPQEVFVSQAYELVGATKSLGAALSSVAAMAQGSPKMMAAAAKAAAGAVSPFIDAANTFSATCPDVGASKTISRSAVELANIGARVILAAKSVASGDVSQKKSLLDCAAAMQRAMEMMLDSLSSCQPGQKEIADAQRNIQNVRTKLDFGGDYDRQNLGQLNDACRSLYEISNTIATVASTSPELLGTFSLRMTNAADVIANASRSAAENAAGSTPQEFVAPIQRAVDVLLVASTINRGDRNRSLATAKDLAQATAEIVKHAKTLAQSTRDPVQRRNAIIATEKLATATVALAQGAKVAMQPSLVEGTREALRDVRSAITTTGDPAAEQLIEAARAVAGISCRLIDTCSVVNSNPKDVANQLKLASIAKSMPASLQAVQKAVSALLPAVKECDEAIAEVEYASSEIESTSIAIAFGQLDKSSGRTFAEHASEVSRAVKDLSAEIKNLAQPKDAAARARAANAIKASMGGFIMAVKSTVASTTNRNTQESLLSRSKELSDALQLLLNSVRTAATGGANDVPQRLTEAEKVISVLAASLKSNTAGVREIDEASKEISAAMKVMEQPLIPHGKSYRQAKVELKFQTQELIKDVADLMNIAKTNAEDAGGVAKIIASKMPLIVAITRETASAAGDSQTKAAIVMAGRRIGQGVQQAVQAARNCAADPKNRNLQKELVVAYTHVGQSVTTLFDTCYSGASGERECEEVAYALGRTMADLDASVLFAAAGAGDLHEATGGRTYEACHNEFLNVSRQLGDVSQRFQLVTKDDPAQVGAVAVQLGELGQRLAQNCKALGALGGDKNTYLRLIDACKAVEGNIQQLVQTGKDSQSEPAIHALVVEYAGAVQTTVDQLVSVAQRATEEAAKGVMELDRVGSLCYTLIGAFDSPDFLGNSEADALSIVAAARLVAAASGELVVGCNAGQEEIVKACGLTNNAIRRLFEATKGGSAITDRSDVRAQLGNTSRAAAEALMRLVEACKVGSKNKTLSAQAKVSQCARDCADRLLEIVTTANLLPGGEGLTLEEDTAEDLDQTAERELGACAALIESVAKDLLSRPSRVHTAEVSVAENVTDSILEAAKAIAQATTALVRGAHAAQRDRVSKLGNPKTKHLYHKDPTWANGLISSAKNVAAIVRELVVSADAAAKGKAEEERLVAAARAVAACTAQLVAASRAKADPASQSQQRLSNAATAVATATTQLVEAARLSAEQEREEKNINRRWSLSPSAKMDYEKQIEILKLEKALEQARMDRARSRKQQYSGN